MNRALPLCILLALGCAKGAADDDGDRAPVDLGSFDAGDGGGRDGGSRDFGPGRDAQPEFPDGGGTCEDDEHPDSCDAATDVGEVMPGDEPLVLQGLLPLLSDEDWFQVRFPPAPEGPGGGAISIELVGDATTVMTLEGPTCGPRTACGEGMAGAITSYSFTDDQAMEGESAYSTRDVPWPETVFIRIHRSGGPISCMPFAVTISR